MIDNYIKMSPLKWMLMACCAIGMTILIIRFLGVFGEGNKLHCVRCNGPLVAVNPRDAKNNGNEISVIRVGHMSADSYIGSDSLVCPRDGYVYTGEELDLWIFESREKDAFPIPLSNKMRHLPKPTVWISQLEERKKKSILSNHDVNDIYFYNYTQYINNSTKERLEEASISVSIERKYLSKIEDYSREKGLQMRKEKIEIDENLWNVDFFNNCSAIPFICQLVAVKQ